MIDFVLGFVAFALALAIFIAGYKLGEKDKPTVVASELSEAEKEYNKAYAEAYSQWLNYSAEQAYKLTPQKKK